MSSPFPAWGPGGRECACSHPPPAQQAGNSPADKKNINIMPHDQPWHCTTENTCLPAGCGWSHHCHLYTKRAERLTGMSALQVGDRHNDNRC
mmetsp:Transcript_14547/g.23320  ORF Transcript_14547/g.23320 Transcript_14547/m.23320 type:complete len:92 (+) Transcript_14547:324-599(+)